MLEPYRVAWVEEVLRPYDYEGFGRLNAQITSTRIATGEHEYSRYGFRRLLQVNGADIWQPDIGWCGGMTELRRIGALAQAYDIPVVPHAGAANGSQHWSIANVNAPLVEFFQRASAGTPEVIKRFEATNSITYGPEGVYSRPSEAPGFGWNLEVAGAA